MNDEKILKHIEKEIKDCQERIKDFELVKKTIERINKDKSKNAEKPIDTNHQDKVISQFENHLDFYESIKKIIEKSKLDSTMLELNSKLLTKILRYLKKWDKQLGQDGLNSKQMVRNDIRYFIQEVFNNEIDNY